MDQPITPGTARHHTKGTLINLHRYFLNPYEDRTISIVELVTFGSAQNNRMIANNPGGGLTARIAATTTALTGLEACVSDEATKLALQKARTDAKDTFRAILPESIAKIHGAVVAAFGPNAPEVTQVFPLGRGIYNTAKDQELDNRLDQLVNSLTPLQAQVGAPAVTLATTLKNNWATIYGAQGTAKGATTATEDAREAAREVLRDELFQNLLLLASLFPGDLAKCDLYCPQHLLRNAQHADAPEPATLAAGAYNASTQKITLTMHSPDATHFDLLRRVVGAPDLEIVAEGLAATTGGDASYEDTIAPGDYEYQAVPKKDGVAGEASEIVTVNAA